MPAAILLELSFGAVGEIPDPSRAPGFAGLFEAVSRPALVILRMPAGVKTYRPLPELPCRSGVPHDPADADIPVIDRPVFRCVLVVGPCSSAGEVGHPASLAD